MSKALVAFDTDKNRDEMFSIIKKHDPKAEKVCADAGAGLFKVDASKADEIVCTVEKRFRFWFR